MPAPEQADRIELLLSDVDGVMTDGGITYDSRGAETKTFSVRDGLGVKLWQRSGRRFGIVTGRASTPVERRAEELGVSILHQGVGEKLPVIERIAAEEGVPLSRVAYVGDDLPDLPAVRAVGFGVAVSDAAEELRRAADHVTHSPGGRGAVRELIETLLRADGAWDTSTGSFHG